MTEYKPVKLYRETHEKLGEVRDLHRRYHTFERSYNEMVGILIDFYLQFHGDGGRVHDEPFWRRKHHRKITYDLPPDLGPTREEMGAE